MGGQYRSAYFPELGILRGNRGIIGAAASASFGFQLRYFISKSEKLN